MGNLGKEKGVDKVPLNIADLLALLHKKKYYQHFLSPWIFRSRAVGEDFLK